MSDDLDVLGLLRKYEHMDALKKQAADEIERLRAEVERLTHIKSVNLYEESLALTLTDIAKWDDLREGGVW